MVRPVQYNRTAKTWGGYTRKTSSNDDQKGGVDQAIMMDEFISMLEGDKEHDQEQLYLADFGLQRGCPAIEENGISASSNWKHDWQVPLYFKRDLFQNASLMVSKATINQWASEGRASPRESWPSLFIGNAGTRTGLHTDYGSSHFWMLTIEGQKDW